MVGAMATIRPMKNWVNMANGTKGVKNALNVGIVLYIYQMKIVLPAAVVNEKYKRWYYLSVG